MQFAIIIIEIIGALGLFLFGMKILSDSIQRAAGDKLKHTLNLMTGNTLKALLTGFGVTLLVQSSSATTVMVVSFVNAGLLSVVQAAGVIFGANVGTTVTAWIVSLIGFKFKISAIALPLVGLGFIMMMRGKRASRMRDYGEAAVGFGLLFLGLEYLSGSLPRPSAEFLHFLSDISDLGALSVLIAAAAGTVLTILLHSSSASTAVVITLAVQNVIGFEMAAGLVLGCNIGTTIDALLASIGAKTNAKRAALLHILFNVLGSVWAIILFRPFIHLVNWLAGDSTVAQHIAMMHTAFNVINVIIFAPFARQLAALVSRLVKAKPAEDALHSRLEYVAAPLMDSPELNLLRARKEISDMAGLCESMFIRFREVLGSPGIDLEDEIERFRQMENYADQMREELSRFLMECAGHDITAASSANISVLLRMVTELEDITDDCFSLIMLLDKAKNRQLDLDKDEVHGLGPYAQLVQDFLSFIKRNINDSISDQQLAEATRLEDHIDDLRSSLKKKARKRMQKGANVKVELLFIDIIRHMEKIGDHAFGISRSLRELK